MPQNVFSFGPAGAHSPSAPAG